VENQPPPLQDYNLFDQDQVLREALEREGGDRQVLGVHSSGIVP
jgi:hypothetical protein